jgi:hypothetical protein
MYQIHDTHCTQWQAAVFMSEQVYTAVYVLASQLLLLPAGLQEEGNASEKERGPPELSTGTVGIQSPTHCKSDLN